nr:MAG TPA: hypothetical protein [Caudoviricetes sp.]
MYKNSYFFDTIRNFLNSSFKNPSFKTKKCPKNLI